MLSLPTCVVLSNCSRLREQEALSREPLRAAHPYPVPGEFHPFSTNEESLQPHLKLGMEDSNRSSCRSAWEPLRSRVQAACDTGSGRR
jgi:hypothetical protein